MQLEDILASLFGNGAATQAQRRPQDLMSLSLMGRMAPGDSNLAQGPVLSAPAMAGGPKQAPAPAPSSEPSYDVAPKSNSFSTFLSGLGSGNGAILPALGGGMKAVEDEEQKRGLINSTYKALVKKGIDPDTARAAVSNPLILKEVIAQAYGTAKRDRQVINNKLVDVETGEVVGDYGAGGDTDETAEGRARIVEKYGQGLDPESTKAYILTKRLPREDQQALSPTDKKAIFKAEDEVPLLSSTIDALTRAKELNKKAFTGYLSGARASIGTNLPDAIVPNFIADPEGAKASTEFNSLMSYEAIKAMSDALKGATTDRELAIFVEILGDPKTPADVRGRTIERMLQLAEQKRSLAQSRVDQLKAGTYYQAPKSAAPQVEDLSALSDEEIMRRLGGGQ